MPKISVIVTIYNLEQYIEKCIDTILNQTFKDFELLLIDDGSMDDSYSLCKKYSSIDERVTVYRQVNQGVSVARNIGLSLAKGDYVVFVDGDDYLHEKFLEKLLTIATINQADITICGFKRTESLNEPLIGEFEKESVILTQEEALKLFLYPTEINMGISVWNKLFKRKCLEGISFRPCFRMNEDKYLLYEALCCSTRIVYTPQVLYYYYCREQSACCSKNYINWLDCVTVVEAIYKDVCEKHPKLELEARYQLVDVYYYVFNIIVTFDDNTASDLSKLKDKLNTLNFKELGPYLRFKQKLSVLMIKNMPIEVYRFWILKIGHLLRKG